MKEGGCVWLCPPPSPLPSPNGPAGASSISGGSSQINIWEKADFRNALKRPVAYLIESSAFRENCFPRPTVP